MGPGEPSIKRFIPPSPWKPGALLQDDGRLTRLSLQTDSEVIKGAASITGLPQGGREQQGLLAPTGAQGDPPAPPGIMCLQPALGHGAPQLPQVRQVQPRHGQQTLAASMLCPWSALTLGAWLPPPRFRRTGPTTCGATGLGLSLLPSFPSLLFEPGVCVLCSCRRAFCILEAHGRFGFTDTQLGNVPQDESYPESRLYLIYMIIWRRLWTFELTYVQDMNSGGSMWTATGFIIAVIKISKSPYSPSSLSLSPQLTSYLFSLSESEVIIQ